MQYDNDSTKLANKARNETEPRRSNQRYPNMKDMVQSSDTNLLNDVNLSDLNALGSYIGESEPRNYLKESIGANQDPPESNLEGMGITSTVREMPDQEDMEESQYNQSQVIVSDLGEGMDMKNGVDEEVK